MILKILKLHSPKGSCNFENFQNHSYLLITNCTRGRAISYTNDIQTIISAFWLVKNMSVNPKSVEFYQCYAKRHSISNLCQDLLTIENTELDLKVHGLHYANELLVRVRLSSQNFCKLAQYAETIPKNVWEKSSESYSLSIRVQTTINHISIFLKQYQGKCFRARVEKGIARAAWYGLLSTTANYLHTYSQNSTVRSYIHACIY